MEKFRETVTDSAGNRTPLSTVNVFDTGTTNPVSIFSDDGVTSESNPFTTGSDGVVKFYAADGRYDVKITKSGFVDILIVDQQLFDRNITGATGGIDNTDSTTIGADSDSSGVGDILFKMKGSTRMELKNNSDLVYNTDQFFLDFSSGNVGLGISSPQATLDVLSGSNIISRFKSSTATGFIDIQDGNTTAVNKVRIGVITDDLVLWAGGAERLRIDSSGQVLVGDTTNANMTQGLTINQGANNDELLAGKSSVVAHGITGAFETDTYFAGQKVGATEGGFRLDGVTEATVGMRIQGYTTTQDDTDTTSSNAQVEMRAWLKSGTNVTTPTAGNIFGCFAGATARLLLKEDGEMHIGNTTLVALADKYDDIQLARNLQLATSSDGKHRVSKDDFQQLVNLKALSSKGDFQVMQGMNAVSLGAISQLWNAMKALATEKLGISEEKLLMMAKQY